MIRLKEGAIFISDAHANKNRSQFYSFLKKIEKKELNPSQLILMGDMFDLLIGGVDYLERFYKKEIELLNKISKNIEVIYIEGNHDFNLQKVFPKAKVFSLESQPIVATYKEKKILLSHGDSYEGFRYKAFHAILRNKSFIRFLNLLDKIFFNKLSKSYLKKLQDKQICKKIENFTHIIKQKILLNDIGVSKIGFVLEGHYHQGVELELQKFKYINFSSYACDERYFTLKGDKITFQ